MSGASPSRKARGEGKERSFTDWLRLVRRAIRATRHVPLSEGKIRVLRLRAALRLPVFVPGDEPMPVEMQEAAEAQGRTSPLSG